MERLSIRDQKRNDIKGKRDADDETLLQLWDLNIEEILEKGNLYSGHQNNIQVFKADLPKRQMIMSCLARKLSIIEGKHWVVFYSKSGDQITLKYTNDKEEVEIREVLDLLLQADELISSYELNKK